MIKGLFSTTSRVALAALLCINVNLCFAQNSAPKGEALEQILSHFRSGLNQVKTKFNVNDNDFETFVRFNQQRINSDQGKLYSEVLNGNINESNVSTYENTVVESYTKLYTDFQKIKKEYPSSVAEFSTYHPQIMQTYTCDSACTNPDFSSGDLNGWYAAYGHNSSLSYFNVTGITGAQCTVGQQKAAQDASTNNSYQVMIMHGGNDPLVPSIPRISPYSASNYAARVGDSTGIDYGVAILQETFKVTAASQNFTYDYAVFLQNPGHPEYEQPFFVAVVLDSNGDTIPACGKYLVQSGYQTSGQGWDSAILLGVKTYYKNWTTVYTPLSHYIGQCVTVRFTCADCAAGGHYGYAYVSTSCSAGGVISSSPILCGTKDVTLTGPGGGSGYRWTGPTNGIVGSDSSQVVTIDSAGTYTVVVTPVTGASCNDTIHITIPKGPGNPPIPAFSADSVCVGSATQFTNSSNPISGPGIKFYWDFYNTGSYEDSTDVNPQWTYNSGGTYDVKLHEVTAGGCAADTIVPVLVVSNVPPTFNTPTVCANQPVNFNNTSNGYTKYYWDFGDPSSAPNDTSTLTNPVHTYTTAGGYTVTLVGKGSSSCPPDTTRLVVTISSPPPTATFTGADSVCAGSSTTLHIVNGSPFYTYSWSPTLYLNCYSCRNVTATPPVTTTYTISMSNGTCASDTTITIKVLPIPTASITAIPGDTICTPDSTLLKGAGGCTYSWTPTNSTRDSIWAKPNVTTTYSLQVTCSGCSSPVVTQQVIVLGSGSQTINLSQDSVCPTTLTTITATGGSTYKWLAPLNSTNSSVNVNPNVTTTYSVVVTSHCAPNDTLKKTVHVIQLPHISYTGGTSICVGSSTTLTASGGGTYQWSDGTTTTNASAATFTPASTKTYTLTVTNGHCSSDSVITVTVNPKPTVTINPSNPSICYGDSTTLTAGGGGTYLWSNGATTSSIKVDPTSNTTYTVVVDKICIDSNSTTVSVHGSAISACCTDTINLGSSTTLTASGALTYAWTPSTNLSCTSCPDPIASPTVTTTYTVVGTEGNGCPVSQSLTVYVETPCADFMVPTVFTPNNDGINDDFVVHVLNPSSYNISIYDRWGKQVYTSTNASIYWNGRINGTENLVPDGVYYYSITASCGSHDYSKKGFVEVVGEK